MLKILIRFSEILSSSQISIMYNQVLPYYTLYIKTIIKLFVFLLWMVFIIPVEDSYIIFTILSYNHNTE